MKRIRSLIALALIPCLLADSGWAAAFSTSPAPETTAVLYENQAIVTPLLNFLRNLLSPTARVHFIEEYPVRSLRIIVPPALVKNGYSTTIYTRGTKLSDMLREAAARRGYEKLNNTLFEPSGKLRRYVLLFLNENDVTDHWETVQFTTGDNNLKIHSPIAGGSGKSHQEKTQASALEEYLQALAKHHTYEAHSLALLARITREQWPFLRFAVEAVIRKRLDYPGRAGLSRSETEIETSREKFVETYLTTAMDLTVSDALSSLAHLFDALIGFVGSGLETYFLESEIEINVPESAPVHTLVHRIISSVIEDVDGLISVADRTARYWEAAARTDIPFLTLREWLQGLEQEAKDDPIVTNVGKTVLNNAGMLQSLIQKVHHHPAELVLLSDPEWHSFKKWLDDKFQYPGPDGIESLTGMQNKSLLAGLLLREMDLNSYNRIASPLWADWAWKNEDQMAAEFKDRALGLAADYGQLIREDLHRNHALSDDEMRTVDHFIEKVNLFITDIKKKKYISPPDQLLLNQLNTWRMTLSDSAYWLNNNALSSGTEQKHPANWQQSLTIVTYVLNRHLFWQYGRTWIALEAKNGSVKVYSKTPSYCGSIAVRGRPVAFDIVNENTESRILPAGSTILVSLSDVKKQIAAWRMRKLGSPDILQKLVVRQMFFGLLGQMQDELYILDLKRQGKSIRDLIQSQKLVSALSRLPESKQEEQLKMVLSFWRQFLYVTTQDELAIQLQQFMAKPGESTTLAHDFVERKIGQEFFFGEYDTSIDRLVRRLTRPDAMDIKELRRHLLHAASSSVRWNFLDGVTPNGDLKIPRETLIILNNFQALLNVPSAPSKYRSNPIQRPHRPSTATAA